MASLPLVSVCIPVHNGENYIREALDSVAAQTYGHIEVVIYNNASTDGTAQCIEEFQRQHPMSLRMIQGEALCDMAHSFYNAQENATGDYIKVLCHDDLLHPECIARQVAIMESTPGLSLVCCQRRLRDENGHILFSPHRFRTGRYCGTNVARACARFGNNALGEPMTGLYRRRDLLRCGNFSTDLKYFIDVDFWCRLLLVGDLYFIAIPLADFRLHASSISSQFQSRVMAELPVWEAHLQRLGLTQNSPLEKAIRRASVMARGLARRLVLQLIRFKR